MHEADHAHSIWSTWLLHRLATDVPFIAGVIDSPSTFTRVLSTGGGGAEGSFPSKRLSFPPKVLLKKKLQLFQIKIFLTTILRNQ